MSSSNGGVKFVAAYYLIFSLYCGWVTVSSLVYMAMGKGTGGLIDLGPGFHGLIALFAAAFGVGHAGIGMGLIRGSKAARGVALVISVLAILALIGHASWVWLGFHVFAVCALMASSEG